MNPTEPLPFSPAAQRNQQPIWDTLAQVLPPQGRALEVASGTGQHAVWFAQHLPGWTWQPTDRDARMLPAIAARVAQAGLPNVAPAQQLDVLAPLAAHAPNVEPGNGEAPGGPTNAAAAAPTAGLGAGAPLDATARFDLVFCANMLHISPWATCAGLMRVAKRHLAPGGVLVVYGPFLEEGVPTAPGNVAFDHSLRGQDPCWGIRHLNDVCGQAAHAGLNWQQRHALPANNLLLVWAQPDNPAP